MKVAFLGKGGSGKSTLATALVRSLHVRGMRMLAVDADHNMDLSYNLGASPSVFLGSDPNRIKEYVGAQRVSGFLQALATGRKRGVSFDLTPDAFTKTVSVEVVPNLLLMTAGPHTDKVRSQEACSHSLAAPLKVYMPLLKLKDNEAVVVDERAGTDPVATGILAAIDLAVIVRDSSINSMRVAEQIRHELELANVRYMLFDNKVDGAEADAQRATDEILNRM